MPPTTQTPHRTPLKRVSQGSLFALSRSGAFPDAPHGLGFLEPAMAEFVDETEALQANLEGMKHLSDSLATFNESFASWLYIMNMNALTTDWTQAPTDASFLLAKRRAEQDAMNAMEALKAKKEAMVREAEAAIADRTAMTEATEAEMTYTANVTTASGQTTKSATGPKKKPGKPKLTAKEKKERALEIEKIISCLPLEFRGSDPNLRRSMEMVIEGLLNSTTRSAKLTDLITPPDLSQARVNKCLIALVNRKVVRKDNSTGTVLYHWQGIP
ncbi:DASH complex subunit DAM1 [Hypsizygus marmoreus]|uniref:DASH complex subunit DAM1 n=1 Tax=Hypsizygus marmoreus TaxID=39966 RepID=A0A369JRH5_HYPMA|nr:DASH complex subunit DAM1 [Hypsizygus marmoreus]